MGMQDQQLFVNSIRQRVESLISTNVWEGVESSRVNDWFRQFEEAGCELLGACLLDNLSYRSKPQVLALFKAALTSPELVRQHAESDLAIIEALTQRSDPGIRLVPVISPEQSPTKSGPYMLRLLARELQIQERWMIWASELGTLPASVHTILAIDDFCGSGRQFVEKFLGMPEVMTFREGHPTCRFVYVAAAAHADGIHAIQQSDPEIAMIAGEILTAEHHFFDGTILDQYQSDGLKQELLKQHDIITGKLHLSSRIGKFGFGALGLAYAFAHGTPNNTLPAFWHDNTDGWTSLLDR